MEALKVENGGRRAVRVGGWVEMHLSLLSTRLGLTVPAVAQRPRHWPGVVVGEGCRASMLGRQGRRVLGEWSRNREHPCCHARMSPVAVICARREDRSYSTKRVVVNLNLSPTLRFLAHECRNALVCPHICLWSDERRCYAVGWRSLELKV